MNTFTIDARNTIARLAAHEHSTREVEKFTSEKELAKLAAQWPVRRLVEIWNAMPGVRRVAKFRDRKNAVRREPSGATIKAIMAVTEWQAHSVRGFISAQLTKKLGLRVQSITRDGERVYRIRP